MTGGSAGLLVFRRRPGGPEFLLVHPGGPFWRGKDARAWSFPKGRTMRGENPLAAAKREFHEETGLQVDGRPSPLTPLKRARRGWTYCWLVEADLDLEAARSNTFQLPDGKGGQRRFPEVDQYAYCPSDLALVRIHASLLPILAEALQRLGACRMA